MSTKADPVQQVAVCKSFQALGNKCEVLPAIRAKERLYHPRKTTIQIKGQGYR